MGVASSPVEDVMVGLDNAVWLPEDPKELYNQ
jgi:hypothetical protein